MERQRGKSSLHRPLYPSIHTAYPPPFLIPARLLRNTLMPVSNMYNKPAGHANNTHTRARTHAHTHTDGHLFIYRTHTKSLSGRNNGYISTVSSPRLEKVSDAPNMILSSLLDEVKQPNSTSGNKVTMRCSSCTASPCRQHMCRDGVLQ